MAAVLPDFSIAMSQKRRACVLDPSLALSRPGLPLAKRLSEVMDVWIPREVWRVLDNTHFYLGQPETLGVRTFKEDTQPRKEPPDAAELAAVLRAWEQMRFNTDVTRLKMFWVGDGMGDSLLSESIDGSVVRGFERLNSSLDSRHPAQSASDSAFCDAIALNVTLPAAFILTFQSDRQSPPAICASLRHYDIPCLELTAEDALVALERQHLRELIVSSGIARFCWAGLRLAVLHLVTPCVHLASAAVELENGYGDDFPLDEPVDEPAAEPDYWRGATAFWYALN